MNVEEIENIIYQTGSLIGEAAENKNIKQIDYYCNVCIALIEYKSYKSVQRIVDKWYEKRDMEKAEASKRL